MIELSVWDDSFTDRRRMASSAHLRWFGGWLHSRAPDLMSRHVFLMYYRCDRTFHRTNFLVSIVPKCKMTSYRDVFITFAGDISFC